MRSRRWSVRVFRKNHDRCSPPALDFRRFSRGMKRSSKSPPAMGKAPKTRAVSTAGYRKGEETRQRILDVALKAFGEDFFLAVTTRRISETAGVSLPTLQYYFGSKEG